MASNPKKDSRVHWERKIMRLCAIGMVSDGHLDDCELTSIIQIIERDFENNPELIDSIKSRLKVWQINPVAGMEAKQYIECIYNMLNGDDAKSQDAKRGLFVDVSALSDKEALEELRDMVYVIKADCVVAEVERMAFVAVAKVFKFSGVDKIWNRFFEISQNDLLECKVNLNMYDTRNSYVAASDVNIIEKAITAYGINGPLRLGLYSAIQRDRYDIIKNNKNTNKTISKIALFTFIISAILVYFECARCIEFKTIAYEYKIEVPHTIANLLEISGDAINQANGEEGENHLFGTNDNEGISLEASSSKEEQIIQGMRDNMENGDTMLLIILVISLFFYVYLTIYKKIKKFFQFKYNKTITILHPIMLILMLWLLYKNISEVNLSLFYAPICVMCMMISIETMIFLREKYTDESTTKNKETSSTLLIVFVVAAVIADLCIGYIELPLEPTRWMIISKAAFSVFLGCISFFAGKFMELTSLQKLVEMERMDDSIQNIRDCLEE